MIKLRVTGIDLVQVYDSLAYLRDRNYKQGVDFDFAYHPAQWDPFVGDVSKYTEFTFYDESVATWFMLAANFKEVKVVNDQK